MIDLAKEIVAPSNRFPEMDLEIEIEKYYYDNFAFISSAHTPTMDIVSDIATHFYELGQRKAAEMYDEIEYNRQRSQEEMPDKDLDKAAENYTDSSEWLPGENLEHLDAAFKAGAKWQKEQMMKDAANKYDAGFKAGSQWLAEQGVSVDANIRDCSGSGYLSLVIPNNLYNRYKSFNDGDRVVVQVRKKEESK